MSYPKKIVQLRPRRGLLADIPPSEVGPDYFTAGNNVHVSNGITQRVPGEAQVYSGTLTTLRNLSNIIDNSGVNYWVYASDDEVHCVTGSTHTDITPTATLTSVASPDNFTTGSLNGIYVFNNGTDVPYYWGLVPATPMAALPGWTAGDQCQALRPFKNFLFALNMSTSGGEFPMQLKWSNSAAAGAVPTTWTAAATNDAGDAELADTPGELIDAAPLRNSLIIYKQTSTYVCDYVGGQFVFNFRKLFDTIGAMSRHCVAEYKGMHYVVTPDDVIKHDGHSAESIIKSRFRSQVFDSIDQDNYRNAFLAHYEREKELWFCYPSSGNTFCDSAAIFNLEEESWSQRDLPTVAHATIGIVSDSTPVDTWTSDSDTWDSDTTIWNDAGFNAMEQSLVLASTDEATPTSSRFVEIDSGNTFDGSPINVTLRKTEMDFDEPTRLKLVKRCYPNVVAAPGTAISIRVGASEYPGGTITWTPAQTFTKGSSERIDLFAQGRYISFEASSSGSEPWQMPGFDLEMEIRGYH